MKRSPKLVTDKKIEGISDIRDESDRQGMRIVIELKRGEQSLVILNNLYKMTPNADDVRRHQSLLSSMVSQRF